MIRWGDKYELGLRTPGNEMHMDRSIDSPMWPAQIIEGPFWDDFEEVEKWVLRYKDGHTLLIPVEQIENLHRIGDPIG